MRKIALLAFSALPLFAGFFPATIQTSISEVNGKSVILKSSFPVNGMSGVVIHKYGNEVEAITNQVVQIAENGTAKLLNSNIIHHDKLPTIKTPTSKNDKVIGGYLYNNVLLLSPDADTYARITSSHKKNWIHPDLYAIYLSQEGEATPTKENLAAFAKANQIGLIYIIKKDSAVLLDPISGKHVAQKSMSNLPSNAQYPFFMRFDEIQTGWFSKSSKGSYYKSMEKI
jgi:hypothetical protein